MPSIADVYVTILPETSRIGPGVKRALRALDDDFRSAGKRWNREMEKGLNPDVDADTTKAKRKIKDLETTARQTKLKVDVDTDRSAFTGIATALRNVQTNATAAAIGLASLPNTIANVASSTVQLSGAFGLMPAAIGTAALAFGSLKVATLGFGDAMKAIRDPEKFGEAVGAIAPNMQELAKSIQAALPEIDKLKFTVQDAFGAGLGEQFTKLSTAYLPMFRTVMSQMAASANTALTTVSQMLQGPAMQADMSQMTGNMSSAFNILSQALAPVVKAFTDIALTGSGFLPKLAAGAAQAANQFAIFIDKAQQTGDLDKWIQGGIDALATLGRIAGDIWNIFMKFSGMDTVGGGLLGMVEGITSTVADFVNSPAGSGAIQTFITTLGTTTQALMPLLGQLLQTLAPVLAGLGGLAAVVIQSLAPALTTWVTAMQPVIAALAAGLTPVLQQLQPVLTEVANQLAGQMIAGITQLLPLMIPLVEQFAQLLIAVMPLLPQLMQLATAALPLFIQALQTIMPFLTQFAAVLTEQANTVIPLATGQVGLLVTGFEGLSNVIKVMGPVFDALSTKIESFLNGPFGRLISLLPTLQGPLARLMGMADGGVPGAPAVSAANSAGVSTSTWGAAPGQMSLSGVPAPAGRRGRVPGRKAGTASQTLPQPLTPPVSSYVAPIIPSGGGGGGGGGAAAGIDSDQKLLAQVPTGSYDASGDLSKGLGDCSSAVEDLVAIMEGRPTGGRSLATGNAAQWLAAHGFQQGSMEGAFNVGYNSHHMQATLPGGTPFNWGSDAAAARGGVGGTGAFDPAFTSHWYRPVTGGDPNAPTVASASTSAYPSDIGMDVTGAGQPKSLRDAQQKVADKEQAIKQAEQAITDFNAKGGGTAKQKEAKEYALAKAKREHADAINDLATAQDKYNTAAGKDPTKGGAAGMGEQFGQDFVSGIMEVFGLDGSLFKDPTQFGLFKLFKGFMGLKPAGGDGASSSDPYGAAGGGGSGGGGITDFMSSFIPGAYGQSKNGSPGNAPGQFMPTMPGASDAGVSPFGQVGAPGTAGPGNVVNAPININNPIGQDHFNGMVQTAQSANYPRVRQSNMHLPTTGG